MSNELFIRLVGACFTVVMCLISAYVIPWLKTKINSEQIALIEVMIEKAVRCAEQIYTPDEWQKKKEYVLEYIIELVNTNFSIDLSEADLDLMIEGIVNEVKRG